MIEENLRQSLGDKRAENLMKLWKQFDPEENPDSFIKFSSKFMTSAERTACDSLLAILMQSEQMEKLIQGQDKIIKSLDKLVKGQDKILKGQDKIIKSQEFVSCSLL